jgi:hypothetical protein
MGKILAVIKGEPTVLLYSLNAVVALAVSFGLHLGHNQEAAVMTIAAAVLTMTTAAFTRPIAVSALTGGLVTALTAAGTFGLHLTTSQVGSLVTVVTIVLMHTLRANVSPAATVDKR